jgi:Neuraminidase (sialidase)
MPSLAEIKTEGALKILLYGLSGSGKTVFASSLPTPILFLDFDGKVDSAAMFHRNDPERLKSIDVRVLAQNLVQSPIAELEKIISSELIPAQKTGKLQFKTLVLDSITTFSSQTLKYIVDSNPGIKRVLTKQGQQPGMQDFGILKREFGRLIPGLITMPCNVIMLGHISTEKDDVTGEIIRGPSMDGSFAKDLPIYFKEVWRSYVDDKGKHWAQTKSDARYSCRSQITGISNPMPLEYFELSKFIK